MSVVILGNDIVHYEVLGRGRPLVFLHGWVGSWRYWIPTMQAASISYRTYAIDMWGFGDTAKAMNNYPLDQQVGLLDLFMQEMGIGKIALVGHGLGAIVAVLYAQRFPRLVDRVMAISFLNENATTNSRLYTSSASELADWLLNRTAEADATRAEAGKTDQKAIQYFLTNLESLDIDTILQRLGTPCLLVYGQNDPMLDTTSLQQQTNIMPENVHHIIFEQSGHFPMLDEPPKFNRLVADFLSLSSGVSPRQLQLKEEWKRRVR